MEKFSNNSSDQERIERSIEDQFAGQGILVAKNVMELYLSNMALRSVPSLDKFYNLRVLWLNNNNLRSLDFLRGNERLAELHLHNNKLSRLSGSIAHLASLRVLTLQKNQLTNLERVVSEFRLMKSLERLNLADNPIAQETDYRYYVIYQVPSVETLDRQEVSATERIKARKIYDQEQERIKDSVAFGSRSQGPPPSYFASDDLNPFKASHPEVGNNFFRENPPYASLEAATEARRQKKSLVEITRLDWAKIPRYAERRMIASGATEESQAQLVTLKIKT